MSDNNTNELTATQFSRFMQAKSVAIRITEGKEVKLTEEEIAALFEMVPELRDFCIRCVS